MRLGSVSIAADDTSSGRAVVTFGAPPEVSALASLKPMTDRRAAIEAAALEWGGGWQESRRRVKYFQLLARDLVQAHEDVIDAFTEVLRRGAGLGDILPQLGVLAAFAAVLIAIASWRMRAVITRG